MLKPDSLRNALTDAVPALHTNPDMLHLFVNNGSIAATLATSLSFEKRYTLNVAVSNFPDDLNVLLVPVMAWVREYQPDIMTTKEGKERGFTFSSTSNSNGTADINISLLLTERTQVTETDGVLQAQDLPEPCPPEQVTRPRELYIDGELINQWNE